MSALRIALLLSVLWTALAYSATIQVPGDQPTIQAAIHVATAGDEIILADGIFTGPGNRDLDYGGLAITIRSASGNPALTTIQCGGSAGDPHRGFLFQSGEGADAVLEGVTVSGGFAPGLPESQGGAVICTNGSSPTFRACVFAANTAKFGGAVYCDAGTSPAFAGCEFVGNDATDGADLGQGGGIAFPGSNPSFVECSFRDNLASLGGGAIWGGSSGSVVFSTCVFEGNQGRNAGGAGRLSASDIGSVRFDECQFIGNSCTNETGGGGGALSCYRIEVELSQCTFEGNLAATGGAIDLSDCHATVTGCVFQENVAHRTGGGAHLNQESRVTLEDCSFFANEARGSHPDLGGGAVHSSSATRTSFLGCLFAENAAPNGSGVYRTQHSFLGLTNCTFVAQIGGAAVGFFGTGRDTLRHTIIAFTESGPAISCASNVLTVECCDIFGNDGGDTICGIDAGGNFSADPVFCDAENRGFSLRTGSPCAPPGATGCGLVGALDVGCGPTSLETRSWAKIKVRYRR